MKTIAQLIAQLQSVGAKLWLKDGKLGADAPKGAITAQMRQEIASRKAEIIEFLQQVREQVSTEHHKKVITAHDGAQGLPLSFAQQSLWFLASVEAQQGSYNEVSLLSFEGQLDIARLGRCIDSIVSRHAILRTVFKEQDGAVRQYVIDDFALALELVDLRHLEGTEQDKQRDLVIKNASAEVFDLQRGPLLSARLLQLGDRQYQLLMVVHHIIVDHFSTAIVQQELAAFYRAYGEQGLARVLSGPEAGLADNAIQYGDFAAWQRETLNEDQLNHYAEYWQQQLADAPRLLELPTDYARPAVKTNRGETHFFRLSDAQVSGVDVLAKRFGVTHFMIFISTLYTLLYRYSAQQDIVIGTPVANRENEQLQPLVGLFVNTLAVRQQFSGDEGFDGLLQSVKQSLLGAFEHQHMPFEKLVERLQPTRTMSHTPIFQVAFAHQVMPDMTVQLPDLTVSPAPLANQSAKFDLTLFVEQSQNAIKCAFEYSTDLFGPAYIERLTGHFNQLLDAVTASPQTPLNRLPLLSPAEVATIEQKWNNTYVPLDNQRTLQSCFEHWVSQTPEAIAVICNGEQATYRQIAEHAKRLATRLCAHGAKANTLVAVSMEKSWQQVAAVYGVLYSGAAYVPIDPNWPLERRAHILDVCDTKLVISSKAQKAQMQWPASTLLFEVDDALTFAAQPIDATPRQQPSDMAYIIFTSGSTGAPKGVVLDHIGPVNTNLDVNQRYNIGQNDKVYGLSKLSFDLSVYDIFGIHAAGGTLVMPSDELSLDADHWRKEVEQYGITVWDTVPALMQMLVESCEQSGQGPSDHIRVVMMSGDWIPLDLPERIWRSYPKAKTFSQGGATEASIWSISYPIERIEPHWNSIPYGRPMANQHFYVLNEALQHCPVKVPGALYIGGIGVAQCYWQDPERSAKSYIEHPTLGRLYRTGDLGCYDEDGVIEFLGREDFQVKVNGYRIELGEIEARLGDFAGIEQALVEVRKDNHAHQQLVAFYIDPGLEAGAEATIDTHQLQQHLSETLPDYMVPSYFMALAQFPLSANGKVDRKALPEPDFAVSLKAYVAPQTEIGKTLCEMLAQLLGLEQVGIKDNFFDLGGHSLLASQWISRIRHHFAIELPLHHLFSAKDISALEQVIEKALAGNDSIVVKAPLLRTTEGIDTLGLSFAQQRLWFIDQLQEGSSNYNIPVVLDIDGSFDVALAERVLNTIVARHQVLRTVYCNDESGAKQRILADATLTIERHDLSHIAPQQQVVQSASHIADDALYVFNLREDLMLKASWLQLASQKGVLLLNMHHIASDGWSMGVLVREFVSLYEAFAKGEASPLPALKVQYSDYVVWQQNRLKGELLDEQLNYWREQLQGAPAVHELPLDFTRQAQSQGKAEVVRAQLPKPLSQHIDKLAQAQQVTPFIVLHAIMSLLLSRHSNAQDIMIGTPVANRTVAEVEPLIGFFVNTLVLRTQFEALSDNADFIELLNQARSVNMAAQMHQDLPFEYLVEQLQIERSLDHTPLFQIMLTMVPNEEKALNMAGLEVRYRDNETLQAKFDLMLDVMPTEDGYRLYWSYDSSLFSGQSIERLATHFNTLAAGLVAAPSKPLSQVNMFSQGEVEQQLNVLNNTEVAFDRQARIEHKFSAQAASNPNAVAVVFDGRTLSYGELERTTNQLARHLRNLGVRHQNNRNGGQNELGVRHQNNGDDGQSIVAIAMERSIELVVAIIAVLKSGGAYMPLDPAYPQERLGYMLSDSEAEIVLTQQHLSEGLPQGQCTCVVVDEQDALWRACSDEPLSQEGLNSTQLAYVIYTSGSTGKPKGVMVEHQALVNRIEWMQQRYGLSAKDRVLQKTPYSFDVSVWEFVWTLGYGATLVVAAPEGHRDPAYLSALIDEQHISVMHFVPSMLDAYLVEQQFASSVRLVVCSGEALAINTVKRFYQIAPKVQLENLYGPTEAAIDVSAFDCANLAEHKSVPIGKPINNIQLLVLDKQLNCCPIGVPGELHIGGAGLARGYLNQPQLSAKQFIDNPFAEINSQRLYKTGDLVRWGNDGELEYLGRIDHQVKLRGLRIELGEIEYQLQQLPQVASALVMVQTAANNEAHLVGYVILADDDKNQGEGIVNALKQSLGNKLPGHMVPSQWCLIEQWPLSANGKIDRRALPKPEFNGAAQDYVAPRNQTEQQLAEIWATLLGLDKDAISVNANFFEIGGHSLLVVRLLSAIEAKCDVKLNMRQLFNQNTIAQLASDIDREKAQQALAKQLAQADTEVQRIEI